MLNAKPNALWSALLTLAVCCTAHAKPLKAVPTCSPIAKVGKCRRHGCHVTLANGHKMVVPKPGAVIGKHGCYNLPGPIVSKAWRRDKGAYRDDACWQPVR